MSYFIRISGNVFGPYSESQLLEMKSKGKIARTTAVSQNENDWQNAGTLSFLYAQTPASSVRLSAQELASKLPRLNTGTPAEVPSSEMRAEENDPDITFEVMLKGKRVSVTRSRLFELARTGQVLPDDTVIIDGTKVFADSIRGIDFGDGQATDTLLPDTTAAAKPSSFHQARTISVSNLGHSGIQNSLPPEELPSYYAVPPRQKGSVIGEWGNAVQSLFSRLRLPEYRSPFPIIIILASILGVLCLLGVGFFFMNDNKYGTVSIEGTVTLDGLPVSGVSVTLHPRDENGIVAGGISKKNGKFTLTTDIVVDSSDPLRGTVPMVSGVKPGEYDVTFYKLTESEQKTPASGSLSAAPKYFVPQKYGDVKTSGIEPISVDPQGTKKFTFELTSESGAGTPTSE